MCKFYRSQIDFLFLLYKNITIIKFDRTFISLYCIKRQFKAMHTMNIYNRRDINIV